MARRFRIVVCALGIVWIGISLASCGGSSTAQYRVVQTIADAPDNLDISVSGKNAFSDVGFGAVLPQSGYRSVSAGTSAIAVFQTGTSTPVIQSTPLNFNSKGQYTVLLTGHYASPTAVVLGDNNAPPASAQIELRVINASPSAAQPLDIYMVPPGTDITLVPPTTAALAFEQESLYIPLPTHNGTTDVMVVVTPSGVNTQQLINHTYTLTDGQIRTLVLVDASPGGGALSFSPLLLADFN